MRILAGLVKCCGVATAFLAVSLFAACDGDEPNGTPDADSDIDGDADADGDGDGDVDADGDVSTDRDGDGDEEDDADVDVEVDVPRAWVDLTLDRSEPQPLARTVHRMVYDQSLEEVVLVGGQPGGPTPLSDIWSWDGAAWTMLTPEPNPLPERKNHGLIYSPDLGTILVFGGIYGGLVVDPVFYNDLWRWDGDTWTDLTPVDGPNPTVRSGHGFVYDTARSRAVLYGGGGSTTPRDNTWEWDGAGWEEVTPEESPPARWSAMMAYDEARAVTVLYGGNDARGVFDDTWEWDGESWTEIEPTGESPPARGFHALAYDPVRERVVLYGGSTTFPPYIAEENIFADHWEWDGMSWELIGDGEGPGKRAGHDLAYDRARNQLVLMGGTQDGTFGLNDIWVFRPVDE